MWNDVFAIRIKQGGAYKSLIKLQAKEAADIAVCHSIRMTIPDYWHGLQEEVLVQ